MRLAQPLRSEARADLLVGGGGKDEVARGLEPFPRQRGDRDCTRRDLPLHVQRAAAPDLTVA
jgi:hypothetical protein